jgi:hypothetical protein
MTVRPISAKDGQTLSSPGSPLARPQHAPGGPIVTETAVLYASASG